MLVREVLSDRYRITQDKFQYQGVEICMKFWAYTLYKMWYLIKAIGPKRHTYFYYMVRKSIIGLWNRKLYKPWKVDYLCFRLSGLSPFLGDSDSETFANVSACEWDFDDDCFDEVSTASKEFIEGLIVSTPKYAQSDSFILSIFRSKYITCFSCYYHSLLKVLNCLFYRERRSVDDCLLHNWIQVRLSLTSLSTYFHPQHHNSIRNHKTLSLHSKH